MNDHKFAIRQLLKNPGFAATAALTLAVGIQPFVVAQTPAVGFSTTALFAESFDDGRLTDRGWYDGSRFTIATNRPRSGKGCLDYTWKAGKSKTNDDWQLTTDL